jgi:hypothetical protein
LGFFALDKNKLQSIACALPSLAEFEDVFRSLTELNERQATAATEWREILQIGKEGQSQVFSPNQ